MTRSTAKRKLVQNRIAVLRHWTVPSSGFGSGKFAVSLIFRRERRKRLDLIARLIRKPRTNNALMLTEQSAAGQPAAPWTIANSSAPDRSDKDANADR
jgi:hypothetical protein